MRQAENRTAPPKPDGWPLLPDEKAQTFGADPVPQDLAPGTKLYRVIDRNDGAKGSFWNTSPPPATEAEWRNSSAVRDDWNGDGGYVTYTVPESGLNAWVGPIAPQRLEEAPVPGFVLPGGDTQVWVPYGKITPDGLPQPTPWNRP